MVYTIFVAVPSSAGELNVGADNLVFNCLVVVVESSKPRLSVVALTV